MPAMSDTRYTPLGPRMASLRFSLPPIGAQVMAVARDAFRQRGFAQAHILAHWPEIVGAAMAEYCAPERLTYPRILGAGDNAARDRAILSIRVDGPVALELRHLEPQIIERINAYYGYPAVARLKITQGPLPRRKGPRLKRFRPLTPEERAKLAQGLEIIEEADLRLALERLGERIMGSKASRDS